MTDSSDTPNIEEWLDRWWDNFNVGKMPSRPRDALLAKFQEVEMKTRTDFDKKIYIAEKTGYEKAVTYYKKALHKVRLCLIGKYAGNPIDNALLEIDVLTNKSDRTTL